MRTYDTSIIEPAYRFLSKDVKDPLSLEEWMAIPANIVLTNEHGDVALFEIGFKNIYTGHYYFNSRGRQAIKAARDFLDELFNTCYNISVLLGLTPTHLRHASWLSRQVGFKSYGFEELNGKQYEVFIITKKEFNANG